MLILFILHVILAKMVITLMPDSTNVSLVAHYVLLVLVKELVTLVYPEMLQDSKEETGPVVVKMDIELEKTVFVVNQIVPLALIIRLVIFV